MKATHSQILPQSGLQPFTTSSLLIPKHMLLYFQARSKFFGHTKYYFQYLVITYARHLATFGIEHTPTKFKNEYQEKGLALQKKNFKPDPLFWEEFRHIGFSFGIAMCKLFTILLELEHKRWIEAGCPEDFQEKPPCTNKIEKIGMNSNFKPTEANNLHIKKILETRNGTVLIRNISFKEKKLERLLLIL